MLNRLFGLLFTAAGAVMLTYVVRQLWRARVSLDWPVVEAQVLEKHLDIHRGRHGSHVPVVRYRYEYDGRILEGDRIIFCSQTLGAGSLEEAQRFIDQFHVGMCIAIRVCPRSA